jgi:hypothetical protein
MRNLIRNLLASVMFGTTATALVASAQPAAATPLYAYCDDIGEHWCQTADLHVTSSHRMGLAAVDVGTTCWMYDADTGDVVGSVTYSESSYPDPYTLTIVDGLYGRYFGLCHNSDRRPSGWLLQDD